MRTTRIHRILHEVGTIAFPGVFDTLSAKICQRCGHLRGKKVISREEYLHKIRAAVEVRGDKDFFIVARTDALAAVNLDEAIARVEAARRRSSPKSNGKHSVFS